MYWIDTHTHITMLPTIEEQDACMQRTLDAGVQKIVLAGVDRDSVEPIIQFCSRHSQNAFAAIGLHPTEVFENFEGELSFMEELLHTWELSKIQKSRCASRENWSYLMDNEDFRDEAQRKDLKNLEVPEYVAIGETGIDLYHDKTYREQQKVALKEQLRWAKKYNLPLIFHVRDEKNTQDAMEEILSILKDEQDGSLRGVFHCYSGTLQQAQTIVEMGFYLGIGGIITFKNSNLSEIVSQINLEKLLIETDAPFLAPVPYRGQTNESSYIPIIGHKVADVKNITPQEVAEVTSRNAEKLFKI